jgi:hypothetical protein
MLISKGNSVEVLDENEILSTGKWKKGHPCLKGDKNKNRAELFSFPKALQRAEFENKEQRYQTEGTSK